MSDDFTKTNLKIVAVDTGDQPATGYVPGSGDVPRMKDPALIGKCCIIHSSLIRYPEGGPLSHIIVVEGSGRYYCDEDQIGVIL